MLNFFRNWSTARKIIGLVIIMLVFTGMVGFTGYNYVSHMKKSQEDMYKVNLLSVEWLNMARAKSRAVEVLTLQVLLADLSKPQQERLLAEAKTQMGEVDELVTNYEELVSTEQERQKIIEVKKIISEYHAERHKAIE